ncbi:MAG: 3-hydroxybutyryl-CoA dehydrogenase [Anaerolineae bacterium]|nr:3-hydroxybutyryl-CoA dehydrogenase [Anaerolineae bacterium]
MRIESVAIIGAGTMGNGIAYATALGGYRVTLYDVAPEFVQRGIERIHQNLAEGVARKKLDAAAADDAKERIHATCELAAAAQCDLIIEAAPEQLELKRQLFGQLDAHAPASAIFASNTSSLSISVMASATQRADRFVGLHFFNPAHLMPLVEIVRGDATSAETVNAAAAFVARLKKTAVLCKDTPAFIVNRVARPFYGEALRLLGEGAADAATLDALMESIGFKMGPFRLMDLIGLDVNFAVTQSVYNAFFQDPKYRPHPIQRQMVESGWLGRKTGRGFYSYE